MLDIDQKYKELFNTYGGKNIRLVFYKDNYRALYPSEKLYPSEQIYPSEMNKDSIAFEITNDMIHSETLSFTESLCSEENLDFGACESTQIEIVVSNPPQDIAGKEFVLIESFFDYELIRGMYIVHSTPREDDKNTRRIIGYDRMQKFDNDVSGWYNALEFPLTLREFRKSLCDFVGVPQIANTFLINDDILIQKTIEPESLNARDVLRYICQINGTFGNINSIGELRFIYIPKKDEITDTITNYKSVESEEYTVPDIDTIKIQNEEGDIGGVSSGGDDMNTYIIEGNFLVYDKTTAEKNQIANNILSVVSGLEYVPAIIEGNGAPWYEVGDRIKIKTNDGDINTIIMRRTSTGIQGVMDTIESTGSQELKRVFNIRSQFLEAKGLTAVLKRTVSEVSNDLKNLEDNTESKFTQTAEQIRLEVVRAQNAENQLSSSITQTATEIRQEVKNTESGLNSKITQTATQIRNEVKNTTDGLSSSITQQANRITQEISDRKSSDNSLSSKIDQTASDITLKVNGKVSKGEVTSNLNSELKITGNSIALTTGHFTINAKNMTLDSNGNAVFSGSVNGASFTGGSINIGNGKFTVDSNGKVVARDITVGTSSNRSAGYFSVLIADSHTCNNLIVQDSADIDDLHAGYIECNSSIICSRIYSTDAGEWWSDERLKGYIENLSEEECFKIISELRPVSFVMNNSGSPGVGFVAQEVIELCNKYNINLPLYGAHDGYYTIPYMNFLPIVIKVLQKIMKENHLK